MAYTKLECNYCHDCLTIDEWNKANRGGELIGTMEEAIPETLMPDDWVAYRNAHGGRMDCPSCGEVCSLEDINAY